MALHPDFSDSPHAILDPAIRWFPADEALRETSMDKLMPPLVSQLQRKVKAFRNSGYTGANSTRRLSGNSDRSEGESWLGRIFRLFGADSCSI